MLNEAYEKLRAQDFYNNQAICGVGSQLSQVQAATPKQIGVATEALYSLESRLRDLTLTLGRTESYMCGPRPCDPNNKDSVDTLLASLQRISALTDQALQSAYSIEQIVAR